MGLGPFRNCSSQPYNPVAIAPNPNPSRWRLVRWAQYDHAHVLVVKYHDCTNFEGIKVMVYEGQIPKSFMSGWGGFLDPHFTEKSGGPIARFRPTDDGIHDALKYAKEYLP